ncbi:MAG: hypothetical protein ACTHM2_05530 [Afipia sp.]
MSVAKNQSADAVNVPDRARIKFRSGAELNRACENEAVSRSTDAKRIGLATHSATPIPGAGNQSKAPASPDGDASCSHAFIIESGNLIELGKNWSG